MNDIKKAILAAIFCVLTVFSPVSAMAQSSACAILDGAVIINNDGDFLGRVASPYNSESIFNEYGKYGNSYNPNSIWNEYGPNGSPYRTNSAFNSYSQNPPVLMKNGKLIGYLSTNKYLAGAMHPVVIGLACYDVNMME